MIFETKPRPTVSKRDDINNFELESPTARVTSVKSTKQSVRQSVTGKGRQCQDWGPIKTKNSRINVNSGGECRRKKVAGTMGRCSKALGGTITLINAMESNAATMILLHLEKYTF